MEREKRSGLAGGLVLILLGGLFLALQVVPGLRALLRIEFSWPWIIIGVGLFMLVLGLFLGAPGLAVPACILGGVGGLLYYQNLTGNWASWAYAWTLFPGFVGLGIVLAGLAGDEMRHSIRAGLWLIFISLVLFFVFGSVFGGLGVLGPYWPVLLVLLGLAELVRSMLGRRR